MKWFWRIFFIPTYNNVTLLQFFHHSLKEKPPKIKEAPNSYTSDHTQIIIKRKVIFKQKNITFDICTPRLLWIPEHCIHIKIPKFTLAHLGPLKAIKQSN